MSLAEPSGVGGFMAVLYFVFVLGYLGVGIYCTVLFIKLALRGIKALDIYLAKPQKTIDMEGDE